jgi:hypothetical protein
MWALRWRLCDINGGITRREMMDMGLHYGIILCKILPALLDTHLFIAAGAVHGPSISTLEM